MRPSNSPAATKKVFTLRNSSGHSPQNEVKLGAKDPSDEAYMINMINRLNKEIRKIIFEKHWISWIKTKRGNLGWKRQWKVLEKTKRLRLRLGQEQKQKRGTRYGHRRRQWTKAVAEILSSRLSECQSFSTHIPILSPHFNKIDDDNNQFAANLISVFDQAEATSWRRLLYRWDTRWRQRPTYATGNSQGKKSQQTKFEKLKRKSICALPSV